MVNGLATEFVVYQGDQQTEDEFYGVTAYEVGGSGLTGCART
jgi:hypothetical protein